MQQLLTIGKVAQRSGLSTSAIRFYEREGLVHSERAANGHRRFRRDVLRRIAFIRIAQRVGLSLAEIAAAVAALPRGRTPTPDDWRRVTESWLEQIDHRMVLLGALHEGLSRCIGCGCLSLKMCELANPEDTVAKLGSGPRYLDVE